MMFGTGLIPLKVLLTVKFQLLEPLRPIKKVQVIEGGGGGGGGAGCWFQD